MKNKHFELHSGVTVVLRSTSEFKETLIAGEDFFYVDSASLPKMQVNDVYWTITIRKDSKPYVGAKLKGNTELRLSRVLTDILNDRSLIANFANERFYDLRKENLLVCPKNRTEVKEDQRRQVLNSLEDLPTEINNVLMEKNRHSSPQEHMTATPLKIEIESVVTVEIAGIKFRATHLSEEEKVKALESIQFFNEKFAVVSQ